MPLLIQLPFRVCVKVLAAKVVDVPIVKLPSIDIAAVAVLVLPLETMRWKKLVNTKDCAPDPL